MDEVRLNGPLVFFSDEGLSIYGSTTELEQAIEGWYLKESPDAVGFDADLNGFRLEPALIERTYARFIKTKADGVKVVFDATIRCEDLAPHKREQIEEYLSRAGQSSNQDAVHLAKMNVLRSILLQIPES